ncbi:MAG: hypothetical protein BroJett021_26380 [Chloroflexota bacterium]|nr:MAG: hypothetical protein BroJett021_26380 [Chloroflexota bacterium]
MNIFSVHAETADIEVVLESVTLVLDDWEHGRPHSLDLTSILGQTGSINQQIAQLRSQANLDGNAIIHSTRPRIGPWIIRFQHGVRRLTWWFTEPLIMQIRLFQHQVVTVIAKLHQNNQQLAQNLAGAQTELTALQKRVDLLEASLAGQLGQELHSADAKQKRSNNHPDLERP